MKFYFKKIQKKKYYIYNKILQFSKHTKLIKDDKGLLHIFDKRFLIYCSWWKYFFRVGTEGARTLY